MGSFTRKSSDQKPCWRLPRHIACLSQTSFIGPVCQAPTIRPWVSNFTTTKVHGRAIPLAGPRRQIITLKMITKRSNEIIEFDSKSTTKQRFKNLLFARCVHYPVLSHYAPPRHRAGTRPAPVHDGHRIARTKSPRWRSGTQKRIHTTPAPTARPAGQSQRRLPHTSNPAIHRTCERAAHTCRTNIRLNSP